MSRAPFNVLVIPYRQTGKQISYCVFQSRDMKIWQFIAGGGEDAEPPLYAAMRETVEESGIQSEQYTQLTAMCHVPVKYFSHEARMVWGDDVLVIPEYSFSVQCDADAAIKLSDEHLAYRWCSYEEAEALLHFDLDKTALYELNERIKQHDI